MAISDETREQRKKLKERPIREKLRYFWDYYKVHTVVALLVLAVAGIFIKDAVTVRDYAFCATVLNAYAMDDQEALQKDFAAYAGIDLDAFDCSIDTSSTLSYETMSQVDLAISQRIVAMTQTGGIDVLISDSEPFTNFAQGGMFRDLHETLSDEEYEQFEDRFFYIERSDLTEDSNDIHYDEKGNLQVVDTSVDHSDPSSMKDPIPVGIYVTSAPKLKQFHCYTEAPTAIFGFVRSAERPEMAHRFLEYLYHGPAAHPVS